MMSTSLLFSIKKSLLLIKKIIQKKGQIFIIYLDPKIIYLFKYFNLTNCFCFIKWTPGFFTNNLKSKPDLIIIMDYNLTFEKVKEFYQLNLPLIFFTQNSKNFKFFPMFYSSKYIINIRNVFLFLVFLQKLTIRYNPIKTNEIKKKKIR